MVFYLYGDNSYEIANRLSSIKTQFLRKAGGGADMQTFDMSEHALSDLLNALNVVPMFSSSRLLIVKNLAVMKLQKEQISKLLQSISSTTNVVFLDTSVDKRSIHYKEFIRLKNAREFKLLSLPQLVVWVKSEVEKHNATIDNRTINVLIETVGLDQWQSSSEIQKLANYSPQVTVENIELLVSANLDQNAFKMTDALLNKNVTQAMSIYKTLKQTQEPDQKILGAIVYQYRTLVVAHESLHSNTVPPASLSISPYALSKAKNSVKHLELSQLKKAYGHIVDADIAIKTGNATDLENLILQLSML